MRGLLALADRWTYARALHPEGKEQFHTWRTHRLPKPLVFDKLVRAAAAGPEHCRRALEGPRRTTCAAATASS